MEDSPKPVRWIGSSRKDLRGFPRSVQRHIGQALWAVHGLTQTQAGEVLGIRQPHVSGLMRGQSGAYSLERLMEFLPALGQDVEITVRATRKEHGHVSVVVP